MVGDLRLVRATAELITLLQAALVGKRALVIGSYWPIVENRVHLRLK